MENTNLLIYALCIDPKIAQTVPKSVFLTPKKVFLVQNQDQTSISPIKNGIIWKKVY